MNYKNEAIEEIIQLISEEDLYKVEKLKKEGKFHLSQYSILKSALSKFKLDKEITEEDISYIFNIPEDQAFMISEVDYVIAEIIEKIRMILGEDVSQEYNESVALGGEYPELIFLSEKTKEALGVLDSVNQEGLEEFAIFSSKDTSFSVESLKRIGIYIIERLDQVKYGAQQLGVEIKEEESLADYGLTITLLGSPKNPRWAIHFITVPSELVLDIYNEENFYDVFKITKEGVYCIGTKIHLRDRFLKEELTKFVQDYYSMITFSHLDSELIH